VARPEREEKKQVSAFVTLDRWRKLRNVATKTTRTQTDLITEAIDDLAAKYGAQPREPSGRKSSHRQRRDRSP
jgi:hypothetical protein